MTPMHGLLEQSKNKMMNQKVYNKLKKFIELYGLPKEIGVSGWISETSQWTYNNQVIGSSTEESKGWIFVNPNTTSLNQLQYKNYWDVDSVCGIVESICLNNTMDKDLLFVVNDREFIIDLNNEDADGKGWDWLCDTEDLETIVRKLKGFPIHPDEDGYDDFDLDPMDFLWSECEEDIVEVSYSLPYHTCFLTWENGASIQVEERKAKLHIKKIEAPLKKHYVFISLPNREYFDDIEEWCKSNNLEYELLCKPETFGTVGFGFVDEEKATLFSLKWMT